MDDRLVELEIRYTHLERQLEDLNQVVISQQKVIDGLLKRVAELQARVADAGDPQSNDRPPHY
jgi:uncharacterized coiled-coil protein SlyX